MSKNATGNLSDHLQSRQQHLSSSQQSLSVLQSQLYSAQSLSKQTAKQLNQLEASHSSLSGVFQAQTGIFNALTYLFDQYRESKGIVVNPAIVVTRTMSAEELTHTDILKEACKSNYQEGFDLALSRIVDLDLQDLEGRTILMHAVINGFYYGVNRLLQRGASVDLVDKQGANALIYCAQIPHIQYFKQIAARTSDINLKTEFFSNSSALHLVISNTRKVMFASELNSELRDADRMFDNLDQLVVDEQLIGFSLGWNIRNVLIKTNLTISCSLAVSSDKPINHEKTLSITRFLVEQRNININSQDIDGDTPLFLAAKNQLLSLVDLLFNSYNATDIPNKHGYTAWDIATFNSLQDLIDILITKKGIDAETVKFWCAARTGNTSVVEQQIKQGIDLNSTIENHSNTTPLIQAVIFNHQPIIRVLANSVADINKADKDGASPLYYSLGYSGQPIQPNTVKFLISKGADISQPMFDGDTPLHMASYMANVGAIKLLLESGASVDATNKQGKTSLHLIIEKRTIGDDQKLTAIKYLLCNSASPTLKDSEEHDAVYLAQNSFPEALPFLEHPETLADIGSFEASIIGELSSWN